MPLLVPVHPPFGVEVEGSAFSCQSWHCPRERDNDGGMHEGPKMNESVDLRQFRCGDQNIMMPFVFCVEINLDLHACALLQSADVTQFVLTSIEGFHHRQSTPIKTSPARSITSSNISKKGSVGVV